MIVSSCAFISMSTGQNKQIISLISVFNFWWFCVTGKLWYLYEAKQVKMLGSWKAVYRKALAEHCLGVQGGDGGWDGKVKRGCKNKERYGSCSIWSLLVVEIYRRHFQVCLLSC